MLSVLVGTESGMGISQITRLADRGSRQGIALVLDRLTEQGLVLSQPANRGFMYRFNRDHVLAPAILCAADARQEIINRLTVAVRGLSPVHGGVFGSFARGEAHAGSDIDVLLVFTSVDDDIIHRVQALADDVRSWTGNRLEPLVLSLEQVVNGAKSGERIIRELLADSVTLHGPNISDLVDPVGAR